jgi:hypothetical protein
LIIVGWLDLLVLSIFRWANTDLSLDWKVDAGDSVSGQDAQWVPTSFPSSLFLISCLSPSRR